MDDFEWLTGEVGVSCQKQAQSLRTWLSRLCRGCADCRHYTLLPPDKYNLNLMSEDGSFVSSATTNFFPRILNLGSYHL